MLCHRFHVSSTKLFAAMLLVACSFLLTGCSPASATSKEVKYPYKVTCTVGMVTDIVKAVAGDKADASGIMGEGVDPHLYQATRADIARLVGSDVVFYSGLNLEGKMTDALIKVAASRPVHAVTDQIDPSDLLEPPEFKGHHDPHVWMDPVLWKKCAQTVAQRLGEYDPANASFYLANFDKYGKQIDALDVYAKGVLETIPPRSRVLITAHDAFNYFSRRYSLEVHGIQGISTESEAGIADINRLVDLLVDRKIMAVFVESSVSEKNVRALIEGAGSRGHRVAVGGTLFSDAMGKPGTYEGTYIGMIDHNVTTICRALGGKAPARGMQEKLIEVPASTGKANRS